MERTDGRKPDMLRQCDMQVGFVGTADGSCLIRCGGTRVICTASVDESVPPFLRGQGMGWVTAEYAMLPASTGRRKARDGVKKDGRSVEISRLIGRALRQAVDRRFLGERTITIDCDVIQGDGGTRTASVTGGFIAMAMACQRLVDEGWLGRNPIKHYVAGISAGIVDDQALLDLQYSEDSRAQVDLNCVMNELGEIIELQGTGEGRAFTPREQQELLELCAKGNRELIRKEKEILGALN